MLAKRKNFKIFTLILILFIVCAILYNVIVKTPASYERLFIANDDGLCYFLDNSGKKVANVGYDYIDLRNNDCYRICKDGKWGFLDKSLNTIVKPKYDSAYNFNCDLAPVLMDKKWFYIDKNGKQMFDKTYIWAGSFNKGIAIVKNKDGYFQINTAGKVIGGPFYYCGALYKDAYITQVSSESEIFIQNVKGEKIYAITTAIDLIAFLDRNYMGLYYKDTTDNKIYCKVIDIHTNKIVIDKVKKIAPTYKDIVFYGDSVQKNNTVLWGILDKQYKRITTAKYKNVISNSSNLYPVEENGKWGYINTEGEFKINCQYVAAGPLINGFAAVCSNQNKKWGIINLSGKLIIEENYNYISFAIKS